MPRGKTAHENHETAGVGSSVSLRLDAELAHAVTAYAQAHDMNQSQAIRMLLSLALREAGPGYDIEFHRRAFAEGVIAVKREALSRFREVLEGMGPRGA